MTTRSDAVRTHYQAAIVDREALLQRVTEAVDAMEPPIDARRLAPLDQFHMGGLAATAAFAPERIGINAGTRVLDAGSGLGGPARYLAETFGSMRRGHRSCARLCRGRGVFLTRRAGLTDPLVTFHEGDLTAALPFDEAQFDLVGTQHVAMNIADRAGLYRELCRVLKPGGRLAFYDPLAADGNIRRPLYPVPWAQTAETRRPPPRPTTCARA